MNKKRFTIYKEDKFKDEWYAYPFYIKDNGKKITETMPMNTAKEVANLLNSLSDDVKHLEEYCGDVEADVKRLQEENEQLKYQLNIILNNYEDYDEDLGLCCICENLEGIYIEQYHEGEYHCKVDNFKVERQKKFCKKFKIDSVKK